MSTSYRFLRIRCLGLHLLTLVALLATTGCVSRRVPAAISSDAAAFGFGASGFDALGFGAPPRVQLAILRL